ncbi:NADP-specific glutamate dehydrogenase [Candidatus Bathyarchaeota archaeon]|nr:MAG: NADP-specific glutamate dehydrogenase [Candidatus Bathyarchaeota archaeon]
MDKYIESVYQSILDKDPLQKEFHQAALEVLETLEPVIEKYPVFKEHKILERIVEPERIIQFRVPWKDKNGEIQINRGYRVQYNSAIGPYKGGFRFHPTVYLGLLKFLGFEQTFKNALTTLPMGGGKGGSDFDPHGKTDAEVESFCHSFMMEMYRHIGQFTDVPAGDIGVGGREIGYLYAAYRKIRNVHGTGVLTGKGWGWGGSRIRPQATGYGNVYFCQEMLKTKDEDFKGKKVLISGSGNVAQYAAEKAMQLGAKVASMSDSSGAVHIPDGMTKEMWDYVMELKNVKRGRISEFAEKYNLEYVKGGRPWQFGGDIALPCATQNELDKKDAEALISSGVIAVGEGANMPTTPDAMSLFLEKGILFSPGKASNAGGVATSGLEMSQNSGRLFWSAEEVDKQLHGIMVNIHQTAYDTAKEFGQPGNYVLGANIAGFMKVANAMVAMGYLA